VETSLLCSLAVAVLASSGLYMITRYSSFLRVLVGLELVAAASLASLVLWGGSLGFLVFMLVVETGVVALAAALALSASRRRGAQSVDELDELRG